MGECIVYQIHGASVAVMWPVIPQYIAPGVPAQVQLNALQIGQKDVPAGVPFWIVDASVITADRTYRDAWELDVPAMGEPSGFGGEA